MTISAFPNGHNPKTGMTEQGMTLRDYFAAAALQGILPDAFQECPDNYPDKDLSKYWAGMAYEIADAMMKARNV